MKSEPADNWVHDGAILFDEVTMNYREDLPPALVDFTVSITPQMKVGIVGRTGSGKSTVL